MACIVCKISWAKRTLTRTRIINDNIGSFISRAAAKCKYNCVEASVNLFKFFADRPLCGSIYLKQKIYSASGSGCDKGNKLRPLDFMRSAHRHHKSFNRSCFTAHLTNQIGRKITQFKQIKIHTRGRYQFYGQCNETTFLSAFWN